jgi:hypothetical protein
MRLAATYVTGFEAKWLGGSVTPAAEMPGTADIQSLADLANAVNVVKGMQLAHRLGFFDDETCRLEPIGNPFGPTLSPMSPEWTMSQMTWHTTQTGNTFTGVMQFPGNAYHEPMRLSGTIDVRQRRSP